MRKLLQFMLKWLNSFLKKLTQLVILLKQRLLALFNGFSVWLKGFLKEWGLIIATCMQALAVIWGVFIQLPEYSEAAIREERTIEYILRKDAEPVGLAADRLVYRQWQLLDQFNKSLLDKNSDKVNYNYHNFVLKEWLDHDNEYGYLIELYAIFNYLNEGVSCVENNRCDEALVRSHIGEYGRVFVRSFFPYICYVRDTWNDPDFGRRVEEFYNPIKIDACYEYAKSIDIIRRAAEEGSVVDSDTNASSER